MVSIYVERKSDGTLKESSVGCGCCGWDNQISPEREAQTIQDYINSLKEELQKWEEELRKVQERSSNAVLPTSEG